LAPRTHRAAPLLLFETVFPILHPSLHHWNQQPWQDPRAPPSQLPPCHPLLFSPSASPSNPATRMLSCSPPPGRSSRVAPPPETGSRPRRPSRKVVALTSAHSLFTRRLTCNSDFSVALRDMFGSFYRSVLFPGFTVFPTVIDINQIRDILPHRYPFLLVDRVIDYKPGEYAVAIKNVSINDDFFQGHFPDRPIMPGVLMVEAMAQVGGIVMLQPEVGGSRENFFFAGIDKVRFRKPVVPGDTLIMRMTLIKLQKRFGIAKMEGKAYVGADLVCEGEFLMATGSE
ncbi:hypothetical protein EJB05_35726, partial [Eragrostis curvula]